MSWFRRQPKGVDPASLWKELEKARLALDERTFVRLIKENAAVLDAQFDRWRQVPEAIASDPREFRRYGETLVAIARAAAAEGNDRLVQALTSPTVEATLAAFIEAIRRGQRLVEGGSYREGIDVLEEALTSLDLSSPDLARYQAIARGAAGTGYARLGLFDAAERELRAALALSTQANDGEGVQTYRAGLEMLADLRSGPDSDVAARLEAAKDAVASAQELADRGSPGLSSAAARTVLAELERLSAVPLRDELRGKCYAILAANSYDAGDIAAAKSDFARAIEAARSAGDTVAVTVYSLNLRELEKK